MIMAYKTPGVYVEEISTFPPSVAEVETAIPAFIGYTVKAVRNGAKITDPLKISSLKEYEDYFGKAPKANSLVTLKVSEDPLVLKDPAVADKYKAHAGFKVEVVAAANKIAYNNMYHSLQIFFANGGGPCYIVSVGEAKGLAPAKADLENGLTQIRNFDEPTLLVAPEAAYLPEADHAAFYQSMIKQAAELKDRFVIIDTIYKAAPDVEIDKNAFRAKVTGNKEELRYAAAYYPWIKTTANLWYDDDDLDEVVFKDAKILTGETLGDLAGNLNSIEATNNILYQQCKAELEKNLKAVLPPSSAIAGVYAYVDTTRGVWKAPANVVLKSVSAPVIQISAAQQGDLNVDPAGTKSINAIRSIAGLGISVWGARTMDGNDKEWKYVNVRRFFNMVEESVQKSTLWAVFEPNTKNTWVKVKGMIESYLLTKWIEGALAGSKPEEAFFVKVGLPETMSSDDILEGKMIVKIGLAVSRPAEFIILQFTHKQQTS
ncbi:MAG: phage tail sheath family protein [Ferruginibacter sp.]|nr:phage tail sheath family protein [Ferruginibacter sp.]